MKSRILVAAALMLVAGAGTAETFDFYVFTYCPTADPLCGFASQQTYRDYMLDAVQNMNLEWERVGISFRPVVFNIQANDYYGVMQGCDGDVSQTIKDRRQEWKANVAGVFPNAVSVAITPGGNWCCSHIPGTVYGNPQDDVYPALFGMFCSTSWDSFTLGSILGHEAGHYFCLVHTQTFQDPATHPPTPDHDNDDCCSIGDTNPDPARREGFDPDGPGGDLDINDNPVNGHEWCSNQPLSGLTDDGSPHPQLCQPTCFLYSNNVLTVTGYQPPSNASMSYYMAGCHGPYVVNGQVTYAFGNDSVDQVRNVCIPGVPERTALPDVCAGHGGDTDHDGICNAQDNCPGDKNTSQKNTDGDADADACDLCPLDPNPTGDQDGDGVGDICDPDKDGDTCDDDTIDEDPDSGKVRIGFTFNGGCGFGIEPVYANASVDSDFDGIKGCQDVDNDNDGICDGAAAHGPGAPGAPPQGCTAGPDPCTETAGLGCYAIQGSPTLCPPSWLDCLGSGCLEFFLKIVSVINPADQIVLDGHFSIVNRTIYTAPFKETTLGQTGKALGGDFAAIEEVAGTAGGAAAGAASEGTASGGDGEAGASPAGVAPSASPVPVRLEIWKRGGVRRGDRLVAVVGEYDPSQVMLGDLSRGALLEITPTMDAAGAPVLEVKAAYADVPPSPVAPLPDADGDRRPDVFDNCIQAANFLQNDADGDGFGNACDADIDGDLMVGDTDVAAVRSCLGADLAYDSPIGEPGDDEGSPPPDPDLIALKMRCGAMDLDDDTRVGPGDEEIAVRMLGLPPGPSSKTRSATRCEPADCDDGKACTHDYCDRATGACVHLPGGCDDGDPCTTDSCDVDSGACRNVPVTCDDGNRCTRDFCDLAAGGCVSIRDRETDGLSCDDGSACTEFDVCRLGICGGTARVCSDGDVCTADACDPATGECLVVTGNCDDGNPCTRDLCDPGSGDCTYETLPDGEPCSDGDACTVDDRCREAACAGQPKSCDDGVLCTADVCLQPSGQCASALIPCDDGDACTIDSCVASTGQCAHAPVPFAQAASLGLTGPVTVLWSGPAGLRWNSYRGTIPSSLMGTRREGYDHVCLETLDFLEDGPTMSIDPGMPEPGTAFYYVVTERNDCGEGPPGFDWTGAPRPNLAPCVAGP